MNVIEYRNGAQIIAPCYVSNMPADTYHAHDSVSNSGLKLVNRSPAHFKYPPERAETRNKVLGSALHMACLEPELFYKTYTLLRGAKDRVCAEYKEAKKIHGEELVLVYSECAKVEGIMNSLYKDTEIRNLLEQPGHNELSGFSKDPETGMICRHRFDKLTNYSIAVDLKTTVDARKHAFSRAIMNYGYHVQNAFYNDQHKWITGKDLEGFFFVAIESESPFACKLYEIDMDSFEAGRDSYRKSLNTYAYCKQQDEWPAYDSALEEISIPRWALNEHEESIIDSMTFTDDN